MSRNWPASSATAGGASASTRLSFPQEHVTATRWNALTVTYIKQDAGYLYGAGTDIMFQCQDRLALRQGEHVSHKGL
jgi:hypothetical protein